MTTLSAQAGLLDVVPGTRVAVLTGSYGRGHDAAADEIARELRAVGAVVDVHDMVDLLPWRLGRLLRAAYYAQLRRRPGSWDATLRQLEPGRPLHRCATRALAVGVRRTLRAVAGADLVLTTHPFGSQVLGQARRRGLLHVPAVTYLTDSSVHAMWVHPGVDLHLGIHDLATAEARRYGGRATTVRPVVPPAVTDTRHASDPLADREVVGPMALLVGGSLGIGELEEATYDVLAAGVMTPVVLCGTNESLRARLDLVPGVVALGWRDDVPDLIAASACVVQNGGGFTTLETLGVGTPLVSYRPIPGHGVANAAALETAGLAPWARTPGDLRERLLDALVAPHHSRLPVTGPSVLDVLTGTPVGQAVARAVAQAVA